jgi:hypothetical protein
MASPEFQPPPGTKNHGDPNLLCVEPQWTDYVIFFATNYFAHAATLISHPGESSLETVTATANALFIPGSGALRAFRYLVLYASHLIIGGGRHTSPLEQAQRAGALVMVISEKTWAERTRIEQWGISFWFGAVVEEVPANRSIYGVCTLPRSASGKMRPYKLIEVPPNVPLKLYELYLDMTTVANSTTDSATYSDPVEKDPSLPSSLSTPTAEPAPESLIWNLPKNRNVAKILISILQIIWGITTLYKARGNQIQLYGYGAFGLTVAPYAIMSIINLITNLLRPEYPVMFMVHTADMDNAIREGGDFRGVVAAIDSDAVDQGITVGAMAPELFFSLNMVGYVGICIILPLAIVGGFSGFHSGQNVTIPTAWIFAWLIVGSSAALWVRGLTGSGFVAESVRSPLLVRQLFVVPLWIPALGGFFVVGELLRDFGVCTSFS